MASKISHLPLYFLLTLNEMSISQRRTRKGKWEGGVGNRRSFNSTGRILEQILPGEPNGIAPVFKINAKSSIKCLSPQESAPGHRCNPGRLGGKVPYLGRRTLCCRCAVPELAALQPQSPPTATRSAHQSALKGPRQCRKLNPEK